MISVPELNLAECYLIKIAFTWYVKNTAHPFLVIKLEVKTK